MVNREADSDELIANTFHGTSNKNQDIHRYIYDNTKPRAYYLGASKLFLAFVDFVIVSTSGLISAHFSLRFVSSNMEMPIENQNTAIYIASILVPTILREFGHYKMIRIPTDFCRLLAVASVACITTLLVMLVMVMGDLEKIPVRWVYSWIGSMIGLFWVAHLGAVMLLTVLERRGILLPKVGVVFACPAAKHLLTRNQSFLSGTWARGQISEAFDCGYKLAEANTEIDQQTKSLLRKLEREMISAIILVTATGDTHWAKVIAERLNMYPISILLAVKEPKDSSSESIQDTWSTIVLQEPPLSSSQRMLKRLFDIIVSSALIVSLAPLMAIIALLIYIENPAPVVFKQPRYGYKNKVFQIFKFRSMYHNQTDLMAETLTRRKDPRVTKVGAVIRRLSFDELPQLFNVLRGDMSIVGPRPHAINAKAAGFFYSQICKNYLARCRMKPGITGWAQVNGWRGTTDRAEQLVGRVRYDLFYIENWSFLLDLEIILKTLHSCIHDKQAY